MQATVRAAPYAAGWNLGPVSVALTATDATSGVATTEYNLDGHGWPTYGPGSLTIQRDGRPVLEHRSTYKAGNRKAIQTAAVRVDRLHPVATAAVTGTEGAVRWYTAGLPLVTLAATDPVLADGNAGSGVATTWYSPNDGPEAAYAGPIVLPQGIDTGAYGR